MTKGVTAFQRAHSWVEGADVVWRGHKHWRYVMPFRKQLLSTKGTLIERGGFDVMTGGYMRTYLQQSSDDYMREGRKDNYAAEWDVPPQPPGGVFLAWDATDHRDSLSVELAN